LFVTAATGDLGPKTNSGLSFNSTSGMLTATNVTVTNAAYSESTWNGDNSVATKNSIRDKIEAMGQLQSTSVDVTYTQIRSMKTSPVNLINSPGAGYGIEVVSATMKYIGTATTYTTSNSGVRIGTDNNGAEAQLWFYVPWTANVEKNYRGISGSITTSQVHEDAALRVYAETDDPTTGTGTMTFYILYRIIPI
jgi:hypothetical protein